MDVRWFNVQQTHIRLRRAELKLYQSYSCFLHSRGPTPTLYHWLVENEPIYHLTVFYRPANLLDDSDIFQIDIICSFLVDGFQNGVNGNRA